MKTVDWRSNLFYKLSMALSHIQGILIRGKMNKALGKELNLFLSRFTEKNKVFNDASQFKSTFHPDRQQLLHLLLDENFACTGPMAEISIRAGIRSAKEIYNWNKVRVFEQSYDKLEERVDTDDFLRVIFHNKSKGKFFCFKLGGFDRKFLLSSRLISQIPMTECVIGLFKGLCKGPDKTLEVIFCSKIRDNN